MIHSDEIKEIPETQLPSIMEGTWHIHPIWLHSTREEKIKGTLHSVKIGKKIKTPWAYMAKFYNASCNLVHALIGFQNPTCWEKKKLYQNPSYHLLSCSYPFFCFQKSQCMIHWHSISTCCRLQASCISMVCVSYFFFFLFGSFLWLGD